ncbi:bifunctional [glutamine synthetase] adenylyltransferase/[glutamine synthetase]-adenylyl-L-tyrosine phosphorylase [Niveispirillum sp. SYP-B3756]|uniref:bifunctional [glutamine synthetase] adenylyltransferase/[glutamine synthetase]-adenylyl-L-tyrosine phosphorylase n=1 Tax=Niveispirillum sp. SYP-B3756 TaxID=2662178 RepID=UPI001290D993|nr:bifunctional [glutamine synthetase] adenylyltransferase/[glutamine synthetase]-adenylyl-L-tyrosine phosphorylase [Niveispirillum sp. SYP-B3756]
MRLIFNQESLPLPGDVQRAAVGLEHWRDAIRSIPDTALAEFARTFMDQPEGRTVLETIFGHSPFLGTALLREIGFFRAIVENGFDAAFADLLTDMGAQYGADNKTDRVMKGLRVAKRRAALLIGLADMAGAWALEQVTGALSDFAQAALQLATRLALRQAAASGKLVLPFPEEPERGSGFIVLAMGKFGARELNYSSDIDLIVLYDDGIVQVPDGEMTRTFVRITRELVRLMDERTADGYVFRTDLRLRPDPGATPVAVSVSAAEAYYSSLGQNWERAAMIKARPVAGDLAAGEGFMDILRHFIWRRNLDFAAIQDIHSIKRQIGAHKGHREKTVNGHNIKIGRGGIREIEFFAQTQQLIYGGRDRSLRVPATVQALYALVEAGRVEQSVADDLSRAYRFLRTVEHRVQMVDDQQTHELPKTDEGVARIAAFLGYADDQSFRQALLETLGVVGDHYDGLFADSPTLSGPGNLVFTGTEDDPETMETLRSMGYANPSAIAGQIRAWHHGRYRATRSQRARELLTELVPTLLAAFGRTAHPDQAFLKFDEFLERLPAGVQLFSLFYANPNLLDLLAEVMGTAPRLAEQLARRPAALDAVLLPGFFDPLPGREELEAGFEALLGGAGYFEEYLDLARRWTSEHRFRAGVHILRHISDADRLGAFLTDVAEVALVGLQKVVEDEFARRHGRVPGAGFAVIALGRLGARSLSLRSDLDLITVYEVPDGVSQSDGDKPLSPNDYFIKLTQRLVNAITAQTAEGQLYEVDMRLRPSGNAGPLAVSFDGFAKYQRESAWTWEHMALTRARPVTGPAPLRARLVAEIKAVLTSPRDAEKLRQDVVSMRARIDQQHHTDDIWSVKHVRGGMTDIQFIAQYLMLLHGPEKPEILDTNTTGALAWLGDSGFLAVETANRLIEAHKTWRRVQGFLRLTTDGAFDAAKAPAGLKQQLAKVALPDAAASLSFDEVESQLRAMAVQVLADFAAIVGAEVGAG